ncbi:ABC transporter permease [Kineothrix sp. MB12-C1]|uniref:ABC transporter permease n=1 Tax=Kineothrix sp. MB12-C1 TaxID=3070215 RepID=UPI0027D273B2|nr:ABC transporter permease subunit [Kineothrix sp. MB12-C1]WMC91066.1 ABC transporter permease subunit [Kineothrix sp. MB12-C1]
MIFITGDKPNEKTTKIWAVLLWLTVWEIGARFIGQEVLLVSPVVVLLRLLQLMTVSEFWSSIAFSFLRIIGGFLLALCVGTFLSGISFFSRVIRELVQPLIVVMTTIPVASFIILILIWVPSRNLAVVISFLMVLPIIYKNILEGIGQMDGQLLEMAQVFQVSRRKRLRYLYIPQLMPYFRTAASLSLGLCWKAGVAAEVIGIPKGSIGEKLYEAKIYLQTPDLFAWTLTIIILSVSFEKLFLFFVDKLLLFNH